MNTSKQKYLRRKGSLAVYTDGRGRKRPITPRVATAMIIPGHDAERHEKEWETEGHWELKNGERIWIPESGIPEEYKLDVPMGFRYQKDPERYRRDSISYLRNRINGLKNQLFEVRNEEDRELIKKLIPYYQEKIGEYERYTPPHRAATHSAHLYRNGAKYREEKKFEEEYGKERGKYVYGAVVGEVRRERQARVRS